MSSVNNNLAMQSGSAVRHLVVLLALGSLCYFAVHAFYGRIDSAVDGRRDVTAPQPNSEMAEPVQAGDALSKIDKEAIVRRNLFLPSSGGQALSPLDDSAGTGGGPEPDLLLVGTIIETEGLNRAVILDLEEKKQVMLSEGDMINGASVRQIYPGKVIISRQGRNELLDTAEAVKIRAAITGMASGAAAASNLGTSPSTPSQPDSSLRQNDESQDQRLRIDLNKLSGTNNRVIVKGRLSDNI